MLPLICLLCILYGLWTWRLRTSTSPHEPPFFNGILPIIGHLHRGLGNRKTIYKTVLQIGRECNEKGGVIRGSFGPYQYYAITDPEDFLTVANTCLEKIFAYKFVKPIFGNGLITGQVDIWKHHRKLLSPAFNSQVLHGYIDGINDIARSLAKDLSVEVGKSVEIINYLKVSTMQLVFPSLYGDNVADKEPFYKYIKAAERALEMLIQRYQNIWFYSDYTFKLFGWEQKQNDTMKTMNDMVNSIIKKKMAARKNCETNSNIAGASTKYKPLLDLILDLAEEGTLTEEEVREELNTMIAATFESTSITILFTLINLGSDIQLQNRVYEEIKAVLGESDRNITKDDLAKLVYTEAVINETIRLFSTVPIIARYVDKDVQLKHYTIPAGSNCFLVINGLNRNSMWGLDADQFRPERWLNPQELPPLHMTHGGFSLGKRSCIGRVFGLISIKIILVHLLLRYRVVADISKVEIEYIFSIKPVSGHHVILEPRNLNDRIL